MPRWRGPPLAEAEHQYAGASVPDVGVGAQENAARREGRPGETQEDGVSEFDDLEKKAEAYAEEHPEQADKGINEVAGFAERDTDHQHDEQIDRAVEAAERHIGQRQDRQGNQD
jgi:MT0933-like antitoxin protein